MNQNLDSNNNTATSRKKQHIENFLKSSHKNRNYFDDVILENNSIPELNFSEIDASCTFLNKNAEYPIMINAITGGFDEAYQINKDLASLAKQFNIPIAVGSQSLGIKGGCPESFKVVRDIMENGTVIANVSANVEPEKAMLAVEMIEADAVQLHLNAPQEMCMKEGDRDFKGVLENIAKINEKSPVPVILKEVGFGMSGKTASRLFQSGIRYIDIGGRGGTNFIEIEDMRNDKIDFSDLYDWGLPTPLSLIQCAEACPQMNIIASGGITSAADAVKSLCLGSGMAAISGVLLKHLLLGGYAESENFLNGFLYKFKLIMLLTGSKTIEDLKTADVFFKGDLKTLLGQ